MSGPRERNASGERSPLEVSKKLSDTELLLSKMNEMRDEVRAQWLADKAELKKAIADLTSRVDCSALFSDEEGTGPVASVKEKSSVVAKPATGVSFAKPAGKKTGTFTTWVMQHHIQTAGDPIAQLRGDKMSVAQARIVVGAGGVTVQGIEGTNVQKLILSTIK